MLTSNKELISKTLAVRMSACISEYEAIKRKRSTTFKTVKEFCLHHKFSHQNFMKIYHRYHQNPVETSLLPQKRGPKFKTRRTDLAIEQKVIELRKLGNNRYEIARILQSQTIAVSPSTVYNICRRNGLHRLKPAQTMERRKIIMSKIGELVHLDCHQLSQEITIANADKTYYLLGLLDDYSRIDWIEVLEDKKALSVMFATFFFLFAFRFCDHV